METLTTKQFKTYLKTLELTIEAGEVTLQDDYGTVSSYTRHNEESGFNMAIIDDVEYEFTEKQMDVLYDVMVAECEQELIDRSNAFTDEDYKHFTNLIYA